jgi:hypothetical protein
MPTATSTLETIMTSVVNTTTDLATTVFATYWPYILVIGLISLLVGWFARLTHIGAGRHK